MNHRSDAPALKFPSGSAEGSGRTATLFQDAAEPTTRLIAFYLPQFHPIPENDTWWGKGFTEWTNVARASPLFPGHYQPHIPADLGFYDLRVPETRIAQAEMARHYGIEAFCYWHYWFAGRTLLERPFQEVLRSGEPDFPFCLAWANQSWTGVWHGAPERILMEQTYPGVSDHEAHFRSLLNAFADDRYLRIDEKPVFLVFQPADLPDPWEFTDLWRDLAIKAGLKGLYFIGMAGPSWIPTQNGFDASVLQNPGVGLARLADRFASNKRHAGRRLVARLLGRIRRRPPSMPTVYQYADFIAEALPALSTTFQQYPCAVAGWDNTPRSGTRGVVLDRATPQLFEAHLRRAVLQVAGNSADKRLVFIKSWNEWAEGNHLEPDQRYGKGYLEAVLAVMQDVGQTGEPLDRVQL